MKARSKHPQLQRYTRNWATHEIMKTLIKNKRSYKKRITSEDDDRDSLMEDGEELEGDGNEGRDDDDDEGNDEGRDDDDEGNEEGNDEDEEGREEENGDDYEGEGNGGDGEGNTEGDDMYAEGLGVNADEAERVDVDDSAVGQRAWDLEWEAVVGSGATTSQSAAAKKLKKSTATSKSVGKSEFKPASATVGLAGTKRKVPEDEDQDADQVAAMKGRRNPARNIRKSKKSRL